MAVKLPKPIDSYFRHANGLDPDAVADCFTPDAEVHDEGHDHVGRAAIRAWVAGVRRRYTFHAEPRYLDVANGTHTVTAHLTGDFPGAPADLRYTFDLKDDRIARLAIGTSP